jgi:hypothetical protein
MCIFWLYEKKTKLGRSFELQLVDDIWDDDVHVPPLPIKPTHSKERKAHKKVPLAYKIENLPRSTRKECKGKPTKSRRRRRQGLSVSDENTKKKPTNGEEQRWDMVQI